MSVRRALASPADRRGVLPPASGHAPKPKRQQALEAVAAYHHAGPAELLTHVADAMDRFRGDELDAFEADHVLFRYSRAAKELRNFCNLGNIEITAQHVREGLSIDWWERGAPKTR